MDEFEKKLIQLVKNDDKSLYISKLVHENGDVVLTVSMKPIDEIMSRWSGTHQRVSGDYQNRD